MIELFLLSFDRKGPNSFFSERRYLKNDLLVGDVAPAGIPALRAGQYPNPLMSQVIFQCAPFQ